MLGEHTVIGVDFVRPEVFILTVERGGLDFAPGQHVVLGVAGTGITREYSIYSGVSEPHLRFLIKLRDDSASALALASAAPGTRVMLGRRFSTFRLPADFTEAASLWMLASGVGIAPFHCMASVLGGGYNVVHGVREAADAYGREAFGSGLYTLCCSRETDGDFFGRVTDWLERNELPGDALVYICGGQDMVSDTYGKVRGQGIPLQRIYTESFY